MAKIDDLKTLIDSFVSKSLEARDASKEAKRAKEILVEKLIEEGFVKSSANAPGFEQVVIEGHVSAIEAKYGTVKKWSSEELEAVYGSFVPEFVKRKLSIAEDAYDKLDDSTKESLSGCFTVEPSVKLRIL